MPSSIATLDKTLGAARVRSTDNELHVSSGAMERTWRFTPRGLVTTRVGNAATGQEWTAGDKLEADWVLPLVDPEHPNGRLSLADVVAADACVSDDDGFSTEHIEVSVELAYPEDYLQLRLVVWVWPHAPGVRTRLFAKTLPGYAFTVDRDRHWQIVGMQLCDSVPVGFGPGVRRRLIGFHADTQNRNDRDLDLLHERVHERPLRTPEFCEWANIGAAEDDRGGIALVKESHRCVNQHGHDGGGFRFEATGGIRNHGWGLLSGELTEQYQGAWASWCVVYGPGDSERQRAFKEFDRTRYPIRPESDAYVQANTWGSGGWGAVNSRDAASQENVLPELESCADLGIDVLQIDEGWQGYQREVWKPDGDLYPDGWERVRRRAEELGVKLALWAPATAISLGDLLENTREGGFIACKLDFANLRSREEIDGLMSKVRRFIAQAPHRVRVNWDLTEVHPRFGYFFAREYGLIYLENRKPEVGKQTVYRPHTVLRDLWQLSTYLPLQKFQGSIQNNDRTDRVLSDAYLHPHDYCVAITLMSSPLFFQQTMFYDEAARAEIRPLLATYREHREAIFRGTVYPIGDKPDNGAWTGFQSHDPDSDSGYLLVFREIDCDRPETALALYGLRDAGYEVRDLHDRYVGQTAGIANGQLTIDIPRAPGFRLMHYRAK